MNRARKRVSNRRHECLTYLIWGIEWRSVRSVQIRTEPGIGPLAAVRGGDMGKGAACRF